MSLAKATHKAVHDALLSTVSNRVYDRVPAKVLPTYPYITFDIDIRDDANTCANSSEVHVTVHIWSNAVGKVEAEEIGGAVRTILAPDDPNSHLAIAGYYTIVSAFDVETYRPSEDSLLTEGVLTFTYLVDPH